MRTNIVIITLLVGLLISIFLHNGTANKLNNLIVENKAMEMLVEENKNACNNLVSDVRQSCLHQVVSLQEKCNEPLTGLIKFINK